MKAQYNTGVIFSVIQDNQDETLNLIDHGKMKQHLINTQLPFNEIKHNDNLSFYVENNDKYSLDDFKSFIKSQCLNANQSTFFELDSSRNAILHDLDDNSQCIGQFSSIEKLEVKNTSDHFYLPTLETFYTIKE